MDPSLTRRAVFACFFSAGLVFASWASRIPDIKTALQLSDAGLGRVLFALPIGQLLCLQVSGRLVARLGSQRVLPLALPAYALTLSLTALATGPLQLAAALFCFGVVGNCSSISINTQGVLTEKLFGRPIMASFHAAWSIAGFAGGLLGLLLINLGVPTKVHFLMTGVLVSLTIPFCLPYLARGTPPPAPVPGRRRWRLPDPVLARLGFIGFCSLATEGCMFDWSGVYFKDVVQAPHSLVLLGYTAYMVTMASGRFVSDGLVGRFGRRRVMQTSGLVASSGLFGAVLFPHLAPCTVAFMVVGLGVSSVVPSVYSLAGQRPGVDPGIALATVASISFLGFLLGPPLIGSVAAATSLRCSFAIIACFGMCIPVLIQFNPQVTGK